MYLFSTLPRMTLTILVLVAFSMTALPVNKAVAEYGDIILNNTAEAMRDAEVDDVIFPHWFHRIRFRCNVCHENIFRLKAGSNKISMAIITEKSEKCGTCHDGIVAWEPLECERCHALEPGWSPGPIQHSVKGSSKVDLLLGKVGTKAKPYSKFMEIASGWHPLALAKSGLPLDKYGLVDWADAVEKKIVNPLWTIDPEQKESDYQYRDNYILFEAKGESMPDVLFPHGMHSFWLQCKICHDTKGGAIFKDALGANNVTMMAIGKGKWCSRCHDKIGFPISDCMRCHNRPKDQPLGKNVLLRKPPSKSPTAAAAPTPAKEASSPDSFSDDDSF